MASGKMERTNKIKDVTMVMVLLSNFLSCWRTDVRTVTYQRLSVKLPSVKHNLSTAFCKTRHFAGQMENARVENEFATLTLIGCRDVKEFAWPMRS